MAKDRHASAGVCVFIGSAYCGNGTVDPGEVCDDGNQSNTDACLNTCVAASCGNGFVEAGVEACDGGPDCTGACTLGHDSAVDGVIPGPFSTMVANDHGGCAAAPSEALALLVLLSFGVRRMRRAKHD